METPLKQARENRGISAAELCESLDSHLQNYYRIERGEQVPKRALARQIYEFFEGDLSLADIYDPEYAATL